MRTLPSSLLDSPYQLAQANLHVSAVPSSLPCREEEYAQILDYLEVAVEEGTGACIYISGVPGTGKTATVREVVRNLNAQVEAQVCHLNNRIDGRNWMISFSWKLMA
jgi:origin recognition complex subunit 1